MKKCEQMKAEKVDRWLDTHVTVKHLSIE